MAPAADAAGERRESYTGTPGVGGTPGLTLYIEDVSARCSALAKQASEGGVAPDEALAVCNEALASGVLDDARLAGTHVNRGVLLMALQRSDEARQDFDRALELNAELAEAYVNRGAIHVAQGRAAEGVADLDRGIALGPASPERAYYNRAIGREDLGDVRGAYSDYRAAAALKPDWEAVTAELSRFSVRPR